MGVILIPTLEGEFSLSWGFYSPAVRRTTHKLHNFQLSLSTAWLHPNSGGTENAEVPTLLGKALLYCSHGNTAAEPVLTPFNGLREDVLQPTNQYHPCVKFSQSENRLPCPQPQWLVDQRSCCLAPSWRQPEPQCPACLSEQWVQFCFWFQSWEMVPLSLIKLSFNVHIVTMLI